MNSFSFALPYIFMFSILFLSIFPVVGRSYKVNKLILLETEKDFIVLLVFALFIGFRGYVYSDCLVYHDFYSTVPSLFDSKEIIHRYFSKNSYGFEPLFLVWSLIFKSISEDYLVWQTLSTLIDLLLINNLFKTYIPKQSVFGFLIFFVFYGFIIEVNLLRNVRAILIFLYSIKWIKNKKFCKYFFSMIVASLFHTSALFYIPLYFVLGKTIKKRTVLLLIIVGNIICICKIQWLKSILLIAANFIPGALGQMLKGYLNSDFYSGTYSLGFGWLERNISFFIFYFVFSNTEDKNERIFYNLFVLYICTFLYCSEMSILVERIPYLFAASYWILYPLAYKKINKKYKIYLLIWLLIICFLKLSFGNMNVLMRYDNILFGAESYQTRRNII